MKTLIALLFSASTALSAEQAPRPPQAPPVRGKPVVTEERSYSIQPTVTREYQPVAVAVKREPLLRARIEEYRRTGGVRAYCAGMTDREHLMRDHKYTAAQLDGLTTDELQLLHGWNHQYEQYNQRAAAAQSYRLPAKYPAYQPSFAPVVGTGSAIGGGNCGPGG